MSKNLVIKFYFAKAVSALAFICVLFTKANACSPIAVPTLNSQNINGCNLELQWTSNTIYPCTYAIRVEVVCINLPFTGTINYTSAPITKPSSAPMAYPLQVINICALCPGMTYQFRAKECDSPSYVTCSSWTPTYTFTVPGVPVPVTLSASASPALICPPQTSQLTATPGGGCGPFTYSWSPAASLSSATIANPVASPTTSTTYTCTVNDLCQLTSATATVTVNIVPPPVAGTASVAPAAVCSGDSVSLLLVGYSSPSAIQWQSAPALAGPWTNISGATTPTYTTSGLTANTCFHAVVTSCGPATSNAVCVTIFPIPNPVITGAINQCMPNPAPLTAFDLNYVSYVWSNGATTSGINAFSGTYSVTITDINGCTGTSAPVTVNIYPNPVATFTTEPVSPIILGGQTLFLDGSTIATAGAPITSWFWDFGDGGTSGLQTPIHNYMSSGIYNCMLIVTTQYSCSDTTWLTIVVEDPLTFYVPNTFTPNGDLHNETFGPVYYGMKYEKDFGMRIYDRWGNEIYKTDKLSEPWNGKVKNKGELVQEDTYVYIITYKDNFNFTHTFTGHVNVIR